MATRTKKFALMKAREMIEAAEDMMGECENKEALASQLEAAVELANRAESFRQIAVEMDELSRSLQDQCSDYVEEHPNVMTAKPKEIRDGVTTAAIILGTHRYVVVWSRDKIRRQMAANFTEEFLAGLPKTLVRSRLVLNEGAAIKLDDKELAKLGLARPTRAYWRREIAKQEVSE